MPASYDANQFSLCLDAIVDHLFLAYKYFVDLNDSDKDMYLTISCQVQTS